MASGKSTVHIKLTAEQREMVRKATGKNAEAIELTAQELEERIAPSDVVGLAE